MINLTDQERDKFILYLEQEVETLNEIIKQMEKLPFGIDKLIQLERNKATAYLLVATYMKSYEKQTL